jgi:hypothetical protein
MPITPVPLPANHPGDRAGPMARPHAASASSQMRYPVPERSAASIPMNRRPHPDCDARREPQALPHPATRLRESKRQTPELAAHPRPPYV